MLKLLHNHTHLTHQQSNAQNSPSQASTICEPRTSRCSSWIQKKRKQRSNCSIHWIIKKAKEFQKNIYFCFIDYVMCEYPVHYTQTSQKEQKNGKFLKTQQWPQDWKKSVFIPIPKKGNAKANSCQCMAKTTTIL